mmetsp:Transcript_2109/g.6052  ORF Transcript_2109/g.6052 Transcript_2109/m.6052 type:complete len:220 (+) Transcript_2109:58-717(+)
MRCPWPCRRGRRRRHTARGAGVGGRGGAATAAAAEPLPVPLGPHPSRRLRALPLLCGDGRRRGANGVAASCAAGSCRIPHLARQGAHRVARAGAASRRRGRPPPARPERALVARVVSRRVDHRAARAGAPLPDGALQPADTAARRRDSRGGGAALRPAHRHKVAHPAGARGGRHRARLRTRRRHARVLLRVGGVAALVGGRLVRPLLFPRPAGLVPRGD